MRWRRQQVHGYHQRRRHHSHVRYDIHVDDRGVESDVGRGIPDDRRIGDQRGFAGWQPIGYDL